MMSAKSRLARIGVDVGGTFTDLVLHDPARDLVHAGKLLTTPDDPSVAIIAGIKRILQETELKPSDLHSVVHGTTLVTNTIIERTGATVGLLTTEGFRDSIEIGRETRYDLYDLFLEVPPTLVPRRRRMEIPERIDADGMILLPLNEEAVATAARQLVEKDKCEALAVAFMHSYRSPQHERRAGEIIRRLYPKLPLSLSADVAPEIREFERSSTACANAYVQPLMQRYLDKLDVDLKALGFLGQLYIMLSGGGISSVREAKEYPIRLIESGPAAGAMAASFLARLSNLDRVVSFDMPGRERRSAPQVRLRSRPRPALPERLRPAVEGAGGRHDRDRGRRRQSGAYRCVVAADESWSAKRGCEAGPGLLRAWRHAAHGHGRRSRAGSSRPILFPWW
jgi:N-methylhydantoinase A